MIKLALFLQREGGIARSLLLPLSVAAGITRGLFIVLINAALVSSIPTDDIIAAAGGVLTIYMACFYFARTLTQEFIERLQSALRLKLLVRINQVDASFLFNLQSGNLQNILTGDIQRVANYSVQLFVDIQALILVLFCLSYIFWVSTLAGLIAVIGFCLSAATCLYCDVRAGPRIKEAQSATSRFLDLVVDSVRGFKELRLNQAKREALEGDLSSVLGEVRDYSVRAEKLISISTLIAQIGMFGIIGTIVFVLPRAGLLGQTDAIQILTAILFAYAPLDTLLARYSSLARAKISLERLRELDAELIDLQYSPPSSLGQVAQAPEFRSLVLERVSVTLRALAVGAPEGGALKSSDFTLGPVDLTIKRGQIIFLHGSNGSGKTTLLTSICGLRRLDGGRFLVNGAPVQAGDLEHRGLFSAVFADFHLFNRFYGLPPQALEKLGGYIAHLGLANRVKINANGLQAHALSAGQRRRLALCIALAEDRPILLLDEFVADQDSFYRAYFYDRLLPRLRSEGRTIIAATHDESRLELCDRLFKMSDGKLQEETGGMLTGPVGPQRPVALS